MQLLANFCCHQFLGNQQANLKCLANRIVIIKFNHHLMALVLVGVWVGQFGGYGQLAVFQNSKSTDGGGAGGGQRQRGDRHPRAGAPPPHDGGGSGADPDRGAPGAAVRVVVGHPEHRGVAHVVVIDIVPNLVAQIIVLATLLIPVAIVFEATLSFLGVGIQPPTADWGSMVAESKTLITFPVRTFPWIPAPFYPALAIALLTVAINFVVDWFLHKTSGLRDEV